MLDSQCQVKPENDATFVFVDTLNATKDILRNSFGLCRGGNAGKVHFGDSSANRELAPRHLWRGTYWSLQHMMSETGGLCVFFGFDQAHQDKKMPPEWAFEGEVSIDLLVEKEVAGKISQFTGCDVSMPDTNGLCVLKNYHHVFAFRSSQEERSDIGVWQSILSSDQLILIAKYQASENFIEMAGAMDTEALLSPDFDHVFPGNASFSVKVTIRHYFQRERSDFALSYNSKISTGMVGLKNQGATCYLNGVLQMLYHVNEFRRSVYKIPLDGKSIKNSSTLALQSIFKKLQLSNSSVGTKSLTAAFGWNSDEAFLQQDANELMGKLLERLQQSALDSGTEAFVERLFSGRLRNYIKCTDVPYASNKDEDFSHIQLDVKGCKGVLESLRKFIQVDKLEGENKYDAGDFGKRDAEKGLIFLSLPPVLTIVLKRFEFDVQSMAFVKVHDNHQFPVRLNMNEFIIAEDQETMKENADYVLHSILVHSGDVGAGHYYAYIRLPSGTDDWYRFNDDKVCKVSTKEAIEYNYGIGDLNRSTSSAYMLLYIRASELKSIMSPLPEGDAAIPIDLLNKLDAEESLQRLEDRFYKRSQFYMRIFYFDERSLHTFDKYTANCDFFSDAEAKTLRVFRNASNLGILVAIIKKNLEAVTSFRIWNCQHRNKANIFPNYVVDFTDFEESDDGSECDSDCDEVVSENSSFYIDREDCRCSASTTDCCREEQEELVVEDTQLMEQFRSFLVRVWPGIDDLDFNCISDNNAVSSQCMLDILEDGEHCNDPELLQLKQALYTLADKWKSHVLEYYPLRSAVETDADYVLDKTLCFVKFFDPLHLIPKSIAIAPETTIPGFRCSDEFSFSPTSVSSGMCDVKVSAEKNAVVYQKPLGGEHILPLKFLRSQYFHPRNTFQDIITQSFLNPLSSYIRDEMDKLDKNRGLESSPQSKLDYLNKLQNILSGDFRITLRVCGKFFDMGCTQLDSMSAIPQMSGGAANAISNILLWRLNDAFRHVKASSPGVLDSTSSINIVIESICGMYSNGISAHMKEVLALAGPYADYRTAVSLSSYGLWWACATKSIPVIARPFDEDSAMALRGLQLRQSMDKLSRESESLQDVSGERKNKRSLDTDFAFENMSRLEAPYSNSYTPLIASLGDRLEGVIFLVILALGFSAYDENANEYALSQELYQRMQIYVAWGASASPRELLPFDSNLDSSQYLAAEHSGHLCHVYFRIAPIAVRLPNPLISSPSSKSIPLRFQGLVSMEVFIADAELRSIRADFLRSASSLKSERRRIDASAEISSAEIRTWPQKNVLVFEGIGNIDFRSFYPESAERIYTVIRQRSTAGDFLSHLRVELGLPLEYNESISPDEGDVALEEGVGNASSKDSMNVECEGMKDCAVSSSVWLRALEANPPLISDACRNRTFPIFPLVLISVSGEHITVLPPNFILGTISGPRLPLEGAAKLPSAVFDLSANEELAVGGALLNPSPPCWLNSLDKVSAETCDSNYFAVQHISHRDIVFMTNQAGTSTFCAEFAGLRRASRSVPVFVFSFVLHGSASTSIFSGAFPRPFLSYICDDDDLDSLLVRFASISGEQFDFKSVRLAVIANRIPTFFPREDFSAEGQKASVWNLLGTIYALPAAAGDSVSALIPRIGIQRSASKITQQRWNK